MDTLTILDSGQELPCITQDLRWCFWQVILAFSCQWLFFNLLGVHLGESKNCLTSQNLSSCGTVSSDL
ncbi:hypothetical protein FGO68_gene11865 [Halteria grandinella]|uniref:Uncharacterized protein n=1 Tax=Halteria grandinella TaxID=5974 RepID=A0A8J8NFE7_HALGN|nr:hypothetical protein FGO68_gene11865 [Halteria grandinella]